MRKLQIKISLVGSHIPIWRRFQITDDFRLDGFHQVIQLMMGWWNSHLHVFEIGGRKFGMSIGMPADCNLIEEESNFHLKNFPLKIGDTINYLYDFSNKWQHQLEIEEVSEGNDNYIACIDGQGCCPYEDAGGVLGYQQMLAALSNPDHPDHHTFLGDTNIKDLPDYTLFDLPSTNRELRRFSLWHNKQPRQKPIPWNIAG